MSYTHCALRIIMYEHNYCQHTVHILNQYISQVVPTGAHPWSMQPWLFSHIEKNGGPTAWRDHSFFINQCHLNPFDMSACDPRSCELQTKQVVFKTGELPSVLPSRNGNSQAELKEFIAKRRSFGGTRCIWCKAPIWGLPVLLTVDGPGSTKQYQSWVYIAVFWVSSTQTHRQIRQDLYECAWCFMWGLANTFYCLEALIYRKHPSTSRSNPEHQVTKTLLISTLHDRSYAFWLLIRRSLTYSDHSLSCTSRKFNMFNFMGFYLQCCNLQGPPHNLHQ